METPKGLPEDAWVPHPITSGNCEVLYQREHGRYIKLPQPLWKLDLCQTMARSSFAIPAKRRIQGSMASLSSSFSSKSDMLDLLVASGMALEIMNND